MCSDSNECDAKKRTSYMETRWSFCKAIGFALKGIWQVTTTPRINYHRCLFHQWLSLVSDFHRYQEIGENFFAGNNDFCDNYPPPPCFLFKGTWQWGGLSDSAFECLKEKLVESESRRLPDSANREPLTPRLGESESRQLPDSASWGVAMMSRGVAIRIF